MATPNPYPNPTQLPASNGRNDYTITVSIDDDAWDKLPEVERAMVISILSQDPVAISADIGATGNCIKRESTGWAIHTQTSKSLFDTNIKKGDAGKKVFVFDTYKKRPH